MRQDHQNLYKWICVQSNLSETNIFMGLEAQKESLRKGRIQGCVLIIYNKSNQNSYAFRKFLEVSGVDKVNFSKKIGFN